MTEKRFELIPMDNSHKFFYGLFDNDRKEYVVKYMRLSYAEVICDLLNELNDENKQLRKEYNLANRFHSLDKSKYGAVVKENEQLKSEIKDLNDILARYEEKELQE